MNWISFLLERYIQWIGRIIKKIYLIKPNSVLAGFVFGGLHLNFTNYSTNDA